MARKQAKNNSTHFKTVVQADLPQGRNGKHKKIVTMIMGDLDRLTDGSALKVPLTGLAESKEKVRSALNRAIHKSRQSLMPIYNSSLLSDSDLRDIIAYLQSVGNQ